MNDKKILTEHEWNLRLAAALANYRAYDDEESARKAADLMLMRLNGKVLVLGEVVKEEE